MATRERVQVRKNAQERFSTSETFDHVSGSTGGFIKELINEVEPVLVKPLRTKDITAKLIYKLIRSRKWAEGEKPTILQVWHQYIGSNSHQLMELAAANGDMLKVWPVDIPHTEQVKRELTWEHLKPLHERVASCPNLLAFLYFINQPLKKVVKKSGTVVTSLRAVSPNSPLVNKPILFHRQKWYWPTGKIYMRDKEIMHIPEFFDNAKKTIVLLFNN